LLVLAPPPPSIPAPLPRIGDVLAGKYEVERVLGQGGMGIVFAAKHTLLRERVAIKLLLGADSTEPEVLARFLNEARAAARIQSEHIARVFDVGQLENGTPYMILEYLEGTDLGSRIDQKGAIGIAEAADILIEAAAGIQQAHAMGIVHRDLKPSNVFLAERNDGSRIVKVLDFGVAKHLGPTTFAEAKFQTSSKALLGSPLFMSPEQVRHARSVDTRTDIWSLGIVLYNAVTASTPFDAETLGELLVKVLEAPVPPLRSHRPDAPAGFEAVVARCLMRDPAARYPTVLELAEALLPFASREQEVVVQKMRRSSARLGPSSPASAPVATATESRPVAGMTEVRPPSGSTMNGVSQALGRSSMSRRRAFSIGLGGLLVASVVGAIAVLGLRSPTQTAASSSAVSDDSAKNTTGTTTPTGSVDHSQAPPATSETSLAATDAAAQGASVAQTSSSPRPPAAPVRAKPSSTTKKKLDPYAP
jgi:eukaryotic-like serine/threonine-protein kinase